MRKLTILVALACTFMSTYAQNTGIVLQKCPPVPENNDDWTYQQSAKTLQLNWEEVQFFYYNFSDVDSIPGTQDAYYETSSGDYFGFPSKAFSIVYEAVNSVDGALLLATDSGIFEVSTNGTLTQLFSGVTKVLYPKDDGTLVYTVEIEAEDPDDTNTTDFYWYDGVSSHLIVSEQAIASGYSEDGEVGFASFALQSGHGAIAPAYLYAIDVSAMTPFANQALYMPEDNSSHNGSGGYGPITKANNKLYVIGNDVDVDVLEWNDSLWTEVPNEIYGFSLLKSIRDTLYVGPFKVNDDYSLELVAKAGNEMVPGYVNYFNGKWYVYNRTLANLASGQLVDDPLEYVPNKVLESSIVKIDAATGIIEIPFKNFVNILPNPASDVITIDGLIDVSIFNTLGEQLNVNWIDPTTINTNSLIPGIYYIIGKNDSEQVVSAQFVVQK